MLLCYWFCKSSLYTYDNIYRYSLYHHFCYQFSSHFGAVNSKDTPSLSTTTFMFLKVQVAESLRFWYDVLNIQWYVFDTNYNLHYTMLRELCIHGLVGYLGWPLNVKVARSISIGKIDFIYKANNLNTNFYLYNSFIKHVLFIFIYNSFF